MKNDDNNSETESEIESQTPRSIHVITNSTELYCNESSTLVPTYPAQIIAKHVTLKGRYLPKSTKRSSELCDCGTHSKLMNHGNGPVSNSTLGNTKQENLKEIEANSKVPSPPCYDDVMHKGYLYVPPEDDKLPGEDNVWESQGISPTTPRPETPGTIVRSNETVVEFTV